MTVCIAAIYKERKANGDLADRIVMATDQQLTDENTNRTSEVGFKLHRLSAAAIAMGSGDIDVFHTISSEVERKLSPWPLPEISRIVDMYVEAETNYRQRFYKRNILDDDTLKPIHVPCLPDVIIAGFDEDAARLWRYRPPEKEDRVAYPPDERTNDGWAIIGDGEPLAREEFLKAWTTPWFGKAQTLFLCYLAKKRAEESAYVGQRTGLYIFSPPFDGGVITSGVTKKFEAVWTSLNKQELRCKQRSYEKAKNIVAKAEETGTLIWKKDDQT